MNAMTDIQTDVLTCKEGLAGRLRLNRPRALHSLNRDMVNGMAAALGGSSGRLRRLQTGFVRSYALSMLGGSVLVIGALLAVVFS